MALTGAATGTPRYTRSPHLVGLVAEAERLAATIGAADPGPRARLAERRAEEAARATLVLDGADAGRLPSLADAEALARSLPPRPGPTAGTADRAGTWLDALRVVDDPADAEVRALELVGAAAGFAADDLAERLLTDPLPALAELHRRLTRGLVADARVGRPRTGDQAVHDASVGRVLYFPADPAAIPGQLALTGGWLASAGTREHGLVTSGVLHLELLRLHPYDAANGRLARAAARLLLRARGLDPDGLAAPEPVLAADPLGYHEEVARTLRRRDLTIWLERWAEAVAEGLRRSARELGVLHTAPPGRALRFLAAWSDPTFTVVDYRAGASVGPEDARADLVALVDAGLVTREPASRGLRYVVADR